MNLTGKGISAVALFLVLSMIQMAAPRCLGSSPNGDPVTGKLLTSGNSSVLVNGIITTADSTILTGSTIETPAGVSATIIVEPLGVLELAPESNVRMEYQAGIIHASVLKGCATLNTWKNTIGTLEGINKIPIRTEPAANSRISTCSLDNTAATPAATVPGAPAGAADSGGIGHTFAYIGAAGVAIFGVVIGASNVRGSDPSPAAPSR